MLETEPQLKETLVADGSVRLIYKHYPLPSHDRADDAAEAAECAAQQDKFWEMKELLFAENASWGAVADLPAAFEGYAAQIWDLTPPRFVHASTAAAVASAGRRTLRWVKAPESPARRPSSSSTHRPAREPAFPASWNTISSPRSSTRC